MVGSLRMTLRKFLPKRSFEQYIYSTPTVWIPLCIYFFAFFFTLTLLFLAVLDSRKHQQKSPVTLKRKKACNFDELELRHTSISKYLTKVLQELYFGTPVNIYPSPEYIYFLIPHRLYGGNDVTQGKVNFRPNIRQNLLFEKTQDIKSLCGS